MADGGSAAEDLFIWCDVARECAGGAWIAYVYVSQKSFGPEVFA